MNKRNNKIDALMITYNRSEYTRKSLSRLIDTADEDTRIWIWHNGKDEETLDVVREFIDHPSIHKFHHSLENKGLTDPTNWIWENSNGGFLSKIDDDCLMPYGWTDTLRQAHESNDCFGVIGCWRFPEEDFVPDVAARKIQEFECGHKLMRSAWIEGSGYMMKRRCVEKNGLLQNGETFTQYCKRLTLDGWVHGWYYPFLYQEHFDDPRSPNTLLKSNEDMQKWAPLSALRNGVDTVDAWENQLKRSARLLQEAEYQKKYYSGWRKSFAGFNRFVNRLIGKKNLW